MNQKFGNARTPMGGRPPNTGRQSNARNRPSVAFGRPSLAGDMLRCSIPAGHSIGFRNTLTSGSAVTVAARRIITVPKVRKDLKDDRNLRDKQVQQTIITKIIKFLDDCANPLPQFNYNQRNFLRNPDTFRYDFKNVFEFIFRYIQPSYQLVKIEDDVLRIMNSLGYPYNLKVHALQQISSKLPEMLGVLEWLVDIVDLENHIHNNETTQVNDAAKWELYISCYKEYRKNKGSENYEPAFEAYRRNKLGDNEEGDAFDELRAQRVACEERLKVLVERNEELKSGISELEQNIADINEDIIDLQKYNADLLIKTNQREQMLHDLNGVNEPLLRKIDKLMGENQAKENLISKQTISGKEARQLVSSRQSIRDEIKAIREHLGKVEGKIFELQPEFFKQSAKIHSDFNVIISGLRALCQTLCNSVEMSQLVAMLDHYGFDEAFADIQKSGTDNKLVKLTAHLKELCDRKSLSYQNSEESTKQKIENLQKEIHKLQLDKENLRTKHELDIERAKRERDDKMRPERDFKHNMDVVKQKHKTTSETLSKFTAQLNIVHEELAMKHKKYIHHKQQLDAQYSELQSQVCDKLTKLVERFQQIQDEKKSIIKLTEEIMSQNAKNMKKLPFGKKGGANKRK